MPAYVIVHFTSGHPTAREEAAPGSRQSPVSERVRRLAADHDGHLSLTPSDPGTSPDAMATIMVADMDRAHALADALRELDGVEAAYPKPGEELP